MIIWPIELKEADENNDQHISKDEFVAFMDKRTRVSQISDSPVFIDLTSVWSLINYKEYFLG